MPPWHKIAIVRYLHAILFPGSANVSLSCAALPKKEIFGGEGGSPRVKIFLKKMHNAPNNAEKMSEKKIDYLAASR